MSDHITAPLLTNDNAKAVAGDRWKDLMMEKKSHAFFYLASRHCCQMQSKVTADRDYIGSMEDNNSP